MENKNKFTVIYSFKIFDKKELEFIQYWKELTELIYKFEGSYGSKLHKVNDNLFIAYAQWPNKNVFDKSGNNLPEVATSLRIKMRECCQEITKEFEMDNVILDLLKDKQYNDN